MLLKWLFNLLLFLWIYHTFIRPWLVRHFSPPPPNFPPPQQQSPAQPNSKKKDDDGEYIDYEEVK